MRVSDNAWGHETRYQASCLSARNDVSTRVVSPMAHNEYEGHLPFCLDRRKTSGGSPWLTKKMTEDMMHSDWHASYMAPTIVVVENDANESRVRVST